MKRQATFAWGDSDRKLCNDVEHRALGGTGRAFAPCLQDQPELPAGPAGPGRIVRRCGEAFCFGSSYGAIKRRGTSQQPKHHGRSRFFGRNYKIIFRRVTGVPVFAAVAWLIAQHLGLRNAWAGRPARFVRLFCGLSKKWHWQWRAGLG